MVTCWDDRRSPITRTCWRAGLGPLTSCLDLRILSARWPSERRLPNRNEAPAPLSPSRFLSTLRIERLGRTISSIHFRHPWTAFIFPCIPEHPCGAILGVFVSPLACQSSQKVVVPIYTLLNDVQMSSEIKDTSTRNDLKSYNTKQENLRPCHHLYTPAVDNYVDDKISTPPYD